MKMFEAEMKHQLTTLKREVEFRIEEDIMPRLNLQEEAETPEDKSKMNLTQGLDAFVKIIHIYLINLLSD